MIASEGLFKGLVALLVTTVLAGCAPQSTVVEAAPIAQNRTPVATELFVRTELFFGTSRPDGTFVSEEQWRQFIDTEVTPRFPEGLTILTGAGQFRQTNGILTREPSVLLILLYPLKAWHSSDRKIEEIRRSYKLAFQQQSVLRVDDRLPESVSF